MIVVDTNVLAYTLIEGTHSALARRVWSRDPDWRLPELWRHEYLNILATYVRHGGATLAQAAARWAEAERWLEGCTHSVDMSLALRLAVEHHVSAYDAQFVALARTLGVCCVTEDRSLLRAFPREAVAMRRFCGD